MNDAVFRLN